MYNLSNKPVLVGSGSGSNHNSSTTAVEDRVARFINKRCNAAPLWRRTRWLIEQQHHVRLFMTVSPGVRQSHNGRRPVCLEMLNALAQEQLHGFWSKTVCTQAKEMVSLAS